MARELIINMSSIDKAPIITIGGEEIVDLCQPLFSSKILRDSGRKVIVGRALAGKPHLISKAVYTSQNMMDLLFSFNGYSNPLTVEAGAVLVVPTIKQLQQSILPNTTSDSINQSIDELKKRISPVDKKRIEFLMSSENNNGDIKTPNMNPTNKQFTVNESDNTISLGSDQPSNDAIQNSIDAIKVEIDETVVKKDRIFIKENNNNNKSIN